MNKYVKKEKLIIISINKKINVYIIKIIINKNT